MQACSRPRNSHPFRVNLLWAAMVSADEIIHAQVWKIPKANPSESVAVVAVPFPAQGHLNQLLHLSLQLASHGLTVHYAAPATHVRQARARVHGCDDDALLSVQFHDLRISTYVSPPPDPAAADTPFPSHLMPLWEAYTAEARAPLASLLGELSACHRRVVVVCDIMNFFAVEEAARLPNGEAFGLECVAVSSIVAHLGAVGERLLRENGLRLVHMETYTTEEFMDYVRRRARPSQSIWCCDGVLANASRALEGEFIDALAVTLADGAGGKVKKLFAVGPLNPLLDAGSSSNSKRAGQRRHECLDWLDNQPPGSVLYVSFGTTCSLRVEQVAELATALSASKQRFIWVLRDADRSDIFTDSGESRHAKLLSEFSEQTEGTGLVITGWAPQLEILAHGATAAEAALDADLVAHKDALRQAERKSMNKSNAFATASHDIRSALAAVKGLIQVSRPDADGNPGIVDNLNQMEVCTNKLFDILNSILDTGKVVSGKMQLEEMEFNMADVLEESVDMANVVGVNNGIEVIWDPCDFSVLKCGNVIGDSKRFKQILDNLLGNAMKFTQEGHVILRAWANRPIVRGSIGAPSRFAYRSLEFSFFRFCFGAKEDKVSQNSFNPLQNDPNSVEFYFEVVDTGIGIPKEKRESVFENYVQVKEGHGGTGLGLGIVQSLVRLMGGEISIKEKEPGERGTCFGFNVFLKMSGGHSTEEDIEEGPSTLSETDIRASVFREENFFKGCHCILFVHGDETRRVLQVWMESIGMKVWMIPEVESISSTLEKVQSSHDNFNFDRCFSSKEMVSQVLPTTLRNNSIMARNLGEHHPLGLLFIVDVSKGQFDDIKRQTTDFVKMKHQVPCKIVCLTDLKTSSKDFRRLEEMSCDLVLRKPVHGSRLYALLMGLRDVQSSTIQTSSLVGHENSVTRQQNIGRIGMKDSANNVALARVERLDQGLKIEDDKPLGGMHILLVEDTLVLQTIQRKMLNQLGATVELAGDGAKAVDMFKAAIERASVSEGRNVPLPYDLIFMDCQMPQMDGYEATRHIREEESRYGIHTPIIALTAHSMEEDLQKAISVGMDLHMTKPIERKRIVEVVHGFRKDSN
uniref:Probable histidine kinase 2 n=1 Tax=Leersia perrieri TaxID=77586 RepID=A0A0D9W8A0_9ORYZ